MPLQDIDADDPDEEEEDDDDDDGAPLRLLHVYIA